MPRLLALALVLLLSGCGDGGVEAPTPTPSATPVFASDEEALAAAVEAYAAYLAVSATIFEEGGREPERLSSVATGDYLLTSIAGFEEVERNGWRSVGRATFDRVQLQSYRPQTSIGIVSVYLCDDVSEVVVLDASGASVVSDGRPVNTYFQVTFDVALGRLLVSGREVWGDGKC